MIHILGLCWNPSTDTFHFSVSSSFPTVITKRITLSTIAKVFDPLGLLSPIIIIAKMLLQELWSIKKGWDDTLPPLTSKKWINFIELLQDIPKLNFPRWISLQSESHVKTHGFCDASQRAIVYYLRDHLLVIIKSKSRDHYTTNLCQN